MKNMHVGFILFFLAFFTVSYSNAQEKQDTQNPVIHITNWINNSANTETTGKYIVLDFWATWCAPCLASTPHINKLEKAFDSNDSLLFISLSDETPEKIRKTLKHFHFSSLVATDTTELTQHSFHIRAIPITFLINKEGKIKWKGNPENLNEEDISLFLKGKPVPKQALPKELAYKKEEQQKDSLINFYRKIYEDTSYPDFFAWDSTEHLSADKLSLKGPAIINEFTAGAKLKPLIAGLLDCPLNQVHLPEDLAKTRISYCFKYKGKNAGKIGDKILLSKLTDVLDLKLETEKAPGKVFFLKVEDTALLKKHRSKKGVRISRTSISGNPPVIALKNKNLDALRKLLSNALNHPVRFINSKGYPGHYDISLQAGPFKLLKSNLKEMGIKIYKTSRPINEYQFNYRHAFHRLKE